MAADCQLIETQTYPAKTKSIKPSQHLRQLRMIRRHLIRFKLNFPSKPLISVTPETSFDSRSLQSLYRTLLKTISRPRRRPIFDLHLQFICHCRLHTTLAVSPRKLLTLPLPRNTKIYFYIEN